MLPASPYKPGKYPPSSLYPRFGDSGTLPPQFRRSGNEHLQAMIARRAASQKLLADRAPQQAERPGEAFYDPIEEPPEVPAEPGHPVLEEPAQMPGPHPPPEPGPEREASPVREGQGLFRNAMHGVG